MKPSILILDDEAAVRTSFALYLAKKGFAVTEAGSLAEARAAMMSQSVDGLLLDVRLPDGSGLDWIREVRESQPGTAIVVMTGIGDIPMAVQAMREGADHFVTKPVNMTDLEVFLRKSLELGGLRRGSRAVRRLTKKAAPFFGESPAARALHEQARLALQHDAPVLLLGETGTGKGVLARWIHEHGTRDGMPFVEVSCAGLPRDLLASELFGHARGAFTSAVADKDGLLDVADGGTLFLDEIGELDGPLQSQFLTVLEEKRYRRLGEVRERRSEFRLICATSRVLTDEVASGRFRPDLYFRINVLPITVPSLRDRAPDMPGLVTHLLGVLGAGGTEVAPDVMAFLQAYRWPGNIRELSNTLERALLLAGRGRLEREHFAWLQAAPRPRAGASEADQEELARFEQAVREHGGNVESAARALGLSRATLYRRLKVARDRAGAGVPPPIKPSTRPLP
jgi:DNA-binding NtrC family response regulator